MNWKRAIGLDNLADEYTFARERIHRLHFGARRFPTIGCPPPAATARSAAASKSA